MDADTVHNRGREEEADSNNVLQPRSSQEHATLSGTVLKAQPDHPSTVSDISAESPSKSIFPFLRLPGEIRNKIYEYPCIWRDRAHSGLWLIFSDKGDDWFFFNDMMQPAITRVNRQLRWEALGLFYRAHKFHLEFDVPNVHDLPYMDPLDASRLARRIDNGELEPVSVVSKLLDAFTPRPQAAALKSFNNLQSLTYLTIGTYVCSARYAFIKRLEFTMSAIWLPSYDEMMDCSYTVPSYKDWDDRDEVREEYFEAIRYYTGGVYDEWVRIGLDHEERDEAVDKAEGLADVMGMIAKQCPHLTRHIWASVEL